jgi:high-affinity iron transporter
VTFASRHRWVLISLGALLLAVLVLQALDGGVSDPTGPVRLSHGAVVFNSGLLVFREGLESILVLAAVVSSLVGARAHLRRPIAAGAAAGLVATAVTWVVFDGLLGLIDVNPLDIQAATGLLAILVLVVVMNWFFHRVYWTGWISAQNRRKKSLLADDSGAGARRLFLGLAALGFASTYREGFEIVLFLQNMRLTYGSPTVLEGVALASVLVAIVAAVTFLNQARLPYKRMLVVTGVMLGVVLVVMVGEQVQEMQQAGWIGTSSIGVGFPHWLGTWFATFPNVEGLAAQLASGGLVLGSYFLAAEMRLRRPRRREVREGATAEVRERTPAHATH